MAEEKHKDEEDFDSASENLSKPPSEDKAPFVPVSLPEDKDPARLFSFSDPLSFSGDSEQFHTVSPSEDISFFQRLRFHFSSFFSSIAHIAALFFTPFYGKKKQEKKNLERSSSEDIKNTLLSPRTSSRKSRLLVALGLFLTFLLLIVFFFINSIALLPSYKDLTDYHPPLMSRVYTNSSELIAEYAQQRRVFVAFENIPPVVKEAFISAEDRRFYDHFGIDVPGILRALAKDVVLIFKGRRPHGASTITQQVARNFLLSNELSITRKLKEVILSIWLEHLLSKEHILELYLNQIYLGHRAYGVAMAALDYFNKPINQLSLSEAAFLAGLPRSPSHYDPQKYYDAAVDRRNYVLDRMLENHYITEGQYIEAKKQPVVITAHQADKVVTAPYVAEEIRRILVKRYGKDDLERAGMTVFSTIDSDMQRYAQGALEDGLIEYDRRHGWRGPYTHINISRQLDNLSWQDLLGYAVRPWNLDGTIHMGIVLLTTTATATIGIDTGESVSLTLKSLEWAGRNNPLTQTTGRMPRAVGEVLTAGDIIFLRQMTTDGKLSGYDLYQIPRINGAIMAMDPHTGRILAMVGGFNQYISSFNRATQAYRQPGSAFKPFVYLAAMEQNYPPTYIILDAPFDLAHGDDGKVWRPENYESDKFYGPAPLRIGLEYSRNLMTIRLAQLISMKPIRDVALRFGIYDRMPLDLARALGAQETTLERLLTAYATLANGGKKIIPSLIDRIQDKGGRSLFKSDIRECLPCNQVQWDGALSPPEPEDNREQVTDPESAYQIIHMLEGVIKNGTAQRARWLNRTLAGKTGTTNESKDAWFIGFSPDLVAGVYVGFDQPSTLGQYEQGATAALPVWINFMAKALQKFPETPFPHPPGIHLERINHKNGKAATAETPQGDILWEAFKEGQAANEKKTAVLSGQSFAGQTDQSFFSDQGDSEDSSLSDSENRGLSAVY